MTLCFATKKIRALIFKQFQRLRFSYFASPSNQRTMITHGNGQIRKLPIPQILCFISSFLRSDDKQNPYSKRNSISYYIALAEEAIAKGDLSQAECYLNSALDVCDSTSTVGVSCVYDMLATLAFKQGDAAKAANIINNAISKLKKNNVPQDDNSIIDFNLKLARLHQARGDYNQAEITFKNCLVVQKKKYDIGKRDEETIKLWINVLFWYGHYLKLLGRHQEASHCFLNAYTLSANVSKIDSKQVMVMLYNLGELAFEMDNYDEALRYLLNAVVIGRAVNSSELNAYFNKIGLIYMHKGLYTEAKKWCENGFHSSKRWADKDVKKEAMDCLRKIRILCNKPRVGTKGDAQAQPKTKPGVENPSFM
ncbi:tetratricopeptide repeat protein 19 homolog, mitochondrial-like [Cimex lectularius]|uniref:Uncharacterized protein n=1 Tax=Cimex lectularius TaxID=79782 RepID=A0A8I6TJ07_CIMLE|nr:tetratricopeptide repeat protein 19 homolog, mitochondrial-like [Cimex lectularius]